MSCFSRLTAYDLNKLLIISPTARNMTEKCQYGRKTKIVGNSRELSNYLVWDIFRLQEAISYRMVEKFGIYNGEHQCLRYAHRTSRPKFLHLG